MKKVLMLIMLIAILSMSIFAASSVNAASSAMDFDDEYNLAINPHNWHMPTISTAKVKVDDNGINFSNMTKDQNGSIYYRGDNLGQFKMSMYIDAGLTAPTEESGAEWRYSNVYITFLVDKVQDNAIAEWAVPWKTNKCYMSLQIGLDAYGKPLNTFVRYNAFANNCYEYSYVGNNTDINIADGQEHLLELSVVNFTEEIGGVVIGSGKNMTALLDGNTIANYKYYDDTYYDAITDEEYEVKISEISGGFGIYTNTDWPTGTAPSKMNNTFTIKGMEIISYDSNPEGEKIGQLKEPNHPIETASYSPQASYETGELIEIKLSELYNYEGTKEVAIEVMLNGNQIGNISNGFWSWMPQTSGNFDIDFKISVSEDNFAINSLTLRVKDAAQTPKSEEPVANKGCSNKLSIQTLIPAALFVGLFFLKRKCK